MFFKVFKRKIAKILVFTFLVRNRKSVLAPLLTAAQWDEIPISWPKVKFLSFIFSSFHVQILFTDSPRTKFRTGQVYTCSRVAWASVDI